MLGVFGPFGPRIGGFMSLVLYISCHQLGDMCNLLGITVNVLVPNCQLLHYGAKLSTMTNCPRCQIVRGAKLSTLHYGAKLSTVLNCPWC